MLLLGYCEDSKVHDGTPTMTSPLLVEALKVVLLGPHLKSAISEGYNVILKSRWF